MVFDKEIFFPVRPPYPNSFSYFENIQVHIFVMEESINKKAQLLQKLLAEPSRKNEFNGLILKVEKAEKRRISKVKVSRT